MTVVCTCGREVIVPPVRIHVVESKTILEMPNHHVPDSARGWMTIDGRVRGVDWVQRCRMSDALVEIAL